MRPVVAQRRIGGELRIEPGGPEAAAVAAEIEQGLRELRHGQEGGLGGLGLRETLSTTAKGLPRDRDPSPASRALLLTTSLLTGIVGAVIRRRWTGRSGTSRRRILRGRGRAEVAGGLRASSAGQPESCRQQQQRQTRIHVCAHDTNRMKRPNRAGRRPRCLRGQSGGNSESDGRET